MRRLCPLLILLAGLFGAACQGADADPELAKAGTALMKKFCYRCHGEKFNGNAKFNVLDRDGLLGGAGKPYVVPGKLDESALWKRIADREMPPEEEPQPSAAEKETMRQWVSAGAPHETRPARALIREEGIPPTSAFIGRATISSPRTPQATCSRSRWDRASPAIRLRNSPTNKMAAR